MSSQAAGYIATAIALSILVIGGLSLSINPNFWTLINSLQILRTIILLKINMPIAVRSMIGSATQIGGLDLSFGLFDLPVNDDQSIVWAINEDPLLVSYYEDYGLP